MADGPCPCAADVFTTRGRPDDDSLPLLLLVVVVDECPLSCEVEAVILRALGRFGLLA